MQPIIENPFLDDEEFIEENQPTKPTHPARPAPSTPAPPVAANPFLEDDDEDIKVSEGFKQPVSKRANSVQKRVNSEQNAPAKTETGRPKQGAGRSDSSVPGSMKQNFKGGAAAKQAASHRENSPASMQKPVRITVPNGPKPAAEQAPAQQNEAPQRSEAEIERARAAALAEENAYETDSELVNIALNVRPLTREEQAQLTPEERAVIGSTQPKYFTKAYRDSLSPEYKQAKKEERAAKEAEKKQQKKDAYARGERPWKQKKTPATKTKTASGQTPPGHKNRKNRSSYHRRDITDRDREVFLFLAKFRYSTVKIIAKMLGVSEPVAFKRLRGLEELGFTKQTNLGIGKIWTVKQKALNALDFAGWHVPKQSIFSPNPNTFDYNSMQHTMSIQWVAVQMFHGEFPNQRDGKFPVPKSWNQFVPEQTMKAARQRLGGNENMRKEKEAAISEVLNERKTWVEFFEEDASRWILPGKALHKIQLKIPDMAVSFEDHRQSERPVSASIEVELSRKSPVRYREIFRAYKYDRHTYGGVIYVVNDQKTGEVVKAAADAEGFKQLKVVPLLDTDGELLKNGLSLLSDKYGKK